MRAELYKPSWMTPPNVDISEINEILDGAWADAASDYAAEWTAKRLTGKRGPVGAQKYLNSAIDERFRQAKWSRYASTYSRGPLWFRITFRHQMSAGSNFLEGLKAVRRHDFRIAIIAAATREFLEVISPADAAALTSFEKLRAELNDLQGVIGAPIVVAALEPSSILPVSTDTVIRHRSRRR